MALGNNQTWVIFWEGSWETSQAIDSRQDTTAACGDFSHLIQRGKWRIHKERQNHTANKERVQKCKDAERV